MSTSQSGDAPSTETSNLDLHLTRLAGWLLNTVGRGLLWALGVSVVVAVVAGATGEFELAWWAAILGPGAFGVVLYLAEAPLPGDLIDD